MIKKFITPIAVLVLLVTYFIPVAHADAPTQPKSYWTVEEVKSMVDLYADKHGLSRQVLHKVVYCESGYRFNAVNMSDSHALSKGSHGVGQFSRETFAGFAKMIGKDYTDVYNPDQSLDVMAWAIKHGYGNHWTCWRNL